MHGGTILNYSIDVYNKCNISYSGGYFNKNPVITLGLFQKTNSMLKTVTCAGTLLSVVLVYLLRTVYHSIIPRHLSYSKLKKDYEKTKSHISFY